MSLKRLAIETGLSVSFLSMVENGERRLIRHADIVAIADALRVSITDLTGQPYRPPGPVHAEAYAGIHALRMAIVDNGLDLPPDRPPRALAGLAEDVAAANRLWLACDYAALGRMLPRLLDELHAAVAHYQRPDEHEQALRLLAQACWAARQTLKALGAHDLALLAVERAAQALGEVGDPVWAGVNVWERAQTLVAAGAYRQAAMHGQRALDELRPHTRDGVGLQVYGALHLVTAFSLARMRRRADAETHLAEAEDVARRTGEGTAFQLVFGPTNVTMHRVACAVEAREPDRAVTVARDLPDEAVERVDSAGRKCAHYADLARAHAQTGQPRRAVELYLRAERTAPQRLHLNPVARENVAELLDTTGSMSSGLARELRGLAYRMGVEHG